MKLSKNILIIGTLMSLLILWNAAALGADLKGTVTYKGRTTEPEMLDYDGAADAGKSKPIGVKGLILGKGNTLGNVFVYIKSGLPDKEYPIPTEPVVLDQAEMLTSPRVLGIRVGQPLKIVNSDNTLHNVHAMPRTNIEFNLAMPKFREKTSKVFLEEELMFPIRCDVHSWMNAWCAVMKHPFFDVTSKNGKFTIKGLDAGTYKVEAWHERLGTRTATITVPKKGGKTLDFSFSETSK